MPVFEQLNEWSKDGDKQGLELKDSVMDKIHVASARDLKKKTKYNDSCAGKLANHKAFEYGTIFVICINAVVIVYDAEYGAIYGKPDKLYDGPLQFIIAELFFAVYFTFEIVVRAIGERIKKNLMYDGWFVFDAVLVTMMLLETFLFPFLEGGGVSGLSVFRLLRLVRMVKIAKGIPELVIVAKGLLNALAAVFWAAVLLCLITYVFAIIFTQTYHKGLLEDMCDPDANITTVCIEPDSAVDFFGSIDRSMYALIIFGSFFDDLTMCTDAIRSSEHYAMIWPFIVFVMLSGWIMLNMVVGILCDVISSTTAHEKMDIRSEELANAIKSIASEMDKDESGSISQEEFMMMKDHEGVKKALKTLELEEEAFEQIGNIMYHKEDPDEPDKLVKLEDLVDAILKNQPGQSVTAVHLAKLEIKLTRAMKEFDRQVRKLQRTVCQAKGETTLSEMCRDPRQKRQLDSTQDSEGSPSPVRPARIPDWGFECPSNPDDARWSAVPTSHLMSELERRLFSGTGSVRWAK